ncbi:MAG: hypothetical protein LUD22_01645 [Coprobacillus sp.]|nr:hypothetical protein [Coprobacillus sp.]
MARRKDRDYFGLNRFWSIILAIIPITSWILGLITKAKKGLKGHPWQIVCFVLRIIFGFNIIWLLDLIWIICFGRIFPWL